MILIIKKSKQPINSKIYNQFVFQADRSQTVLLENKLILYTEYQPGGAGGTRSPPATPHRLQHLTACFIQNGRRGPEIGQTLSYWTLRSTFAK